MSSKLFRSVLLALVISRIKFCMISTSEKRNPALECNARIPPVKPELFRERKELGICNRGAAFRHHRGDFYLAGIRSRACEQSILVRMLDYGTVVVSGTGGSKEAFHTIAEPMMFRRRVQDQIATIEGRRNTESEQRKNLARNLHEQPCDDWVRNRDLVNISTLELGEEIARVHCTSLLVGVEIFSTSALKRGSLRIESQTGSSL